jgi:multidrug transporter EmrE-like cation transporter
MVSLSLAAAVILNATANILIKVGMMRMGSIDGLRVPEIIAKMALNYVLWLGCLSFAVALVAYSYALSKINLSVAYPIMTSLGYAIVILASILFLRETLSAMKVIGILFIIAGVWMVAR